MHRLMPPQLLLRVHDIGYLLTTPLPVWQQCTEGEEIELWVFSDIREDRFDLYGFSSEQDRRFFGALMNLQGIGPKTALELCSIPRSMLERAVALRDPTPLTDVKGVGRKTAEKLLVELSSLYESHPETLAAPPGESRSGLDHDALEALTGLGYDQRDVLEQLRSLPQSVSVTEDRITAVLRALSAKNVAAQQAKQRNPLEQNQPKR